MDTSIPTKRRPSNFKDLSGQQCGLWTVIALSTRTASGGACWDCICECGTRRSVKGCDLRIGRSKGCGCARKTSPFSTNDPQYATKMARRRREQFPEKYKMIERRSGYRKRYNLELEDIEAMLVEQNGRCRICQKTITFGGRAGAKVDHCHSTGKVRGILCSICNTALGSFKDNTEALARAIKYLRGEI